MRSFALRGFFTGPASTGRWKERSAEFSDKTAGRS
jgi:hypothetical protein